MQVSNGELWLTCYALEPGKPGLLQELLKEPWPVKTAYALTKLARKLRTAASDVEEVRQRLIREYGTPNDRGMIEIRSDNPKMAEFSAKYNELMAETTELDAEKVTLPDADVNVAPTTLLALESFVDVA